MRIVPLGPSAGREVLAALKRNDVVCLLSDSDIQRTGIEVEFFGETTTIPAGPATLSIRTGAPILPTAVYFTDRIDGHLGIVRPPVDVSRSNEGLRADVRRVSQSLAGELEFLIRRTPRPSGTCSNRTGRATRGTNTEAQLAGSRHVLAIASSTAA